MRNIGLVLATMVTCIAGRGYYGELSDEEIQRINQDGTVVHPVQMMKWVLKDPNMVEGMKRKDPAMLEIVKAGDVDAFQARMREMNKGRSVSDEDGSALHPEEYMQHMKMEMEHFDGMKKNDPDLFKVVKAGDIDGLQKLLRDRFERLREARAREEYHKNEPPPPATPYDGLGSVDMSFRVRKDNGEEVDMFSLRPNENTEETHGSGMPVHMVCAACAAFTYQAAVALPEAFVFNAKRKKGKKRGGISATEGAVRKSLSQVTSETIEDMCANSTLFSHEYAIEPSKRGINILTGPGVPADINSFTGDESIMLQKQHSNHVGKMMSTACYEHLLGSEEDEEIGPTTEKAVAEGDDVGEALRALLCTKRCLLYDIDQNEAPPAPKKKKKKGGKKKAKEEL